MHTLKPPAPIAAIIYDEGRRISPLIDTVVTQLRAAGYQLAGLRQINLPQSGQARCDMILEDLASGDTVAISEDRGTGARGCRLDVDALLKAMARARGALVEGADLLLVNKFGKTESEGGGLRPLIVTAMEREVPVLVAVPLGNLGGWRAFAGELAVEHQLCDLPEDAARLVEQLGFATQNDRTLRACAAVEWPAA